MSDALRQTDRTTLRRRRQRGTYDRSIAYPLLDEALVCHVAWVHDGAPMLQPMAFVRVGDTLYLHGSPNNRALLTLAGGAAASLAVSVVDGLVLAKSAGHHSLNYRSVVLFGEGRRVIDDVERRACLEAVLEKVVPGRSPYTHPVTDDDLRTTLVVAFAIDEGSAKVRSGPPGDEDGAALGFVGVVPLRTVADPAIAAPDSASGVPHLSLVETIREPTLSDALGVLRAAFRTDDVSSGLVAHRVARYLRAQPDGWFVVRAQRDAASPPELAAVGGALVFGATAYLGLIGTAPGFQRRGLGRAVTERLCRFCEAKGVRRVLLDASASGAPVYRKLGFVVDDEAVIYVAPAAPSVLGEGIARATADDTAAIVALDRDAWSDDRSALLRATLAACEGFVHRDGAGVVDGYAVGQPGGVGPIVARTPEVAGALLDAARGACTVATPRVIVRASQVGMVSVLAARGFREERRLLHMRLGEERAPTPWVWAQESLAGG
jgi:nitroimidazol reductase NimA-like FMN-containing flavoprotein (pyridoxamine 5'-phosphate oxidase superfamily)/ribosomal protein S18 acetylase RimI-like enzyme